MKAPLTNQALHGFTDKAAQLAGNLREITKMIETGKVEQLTDTWSQVAALQNLISAASELTGKIVMREQVQRQQADLARLKGEKV